MAWVEMHGEVVPRWVTIVLIVPWLLSSHLYVRRVQTAALKQWLSTAVGLIAIVIVFDVLTLCHLLAMYLVSVMAIFCNGRRNCFIPTFSVAIFHMGYFFALKHFPWDGLDVTNERGFFAVALLLKMVHLAREVQDVSELEGTNSPALDRRQKVYTHLTLLDIFHYSFCYLSLVSAFLRYRTYHDWLHHPLYQHAVTSLRPAVIQMALACCVCLPMRFVAIHLLFLEEVTPDNISERNMLWLCLCISVVGLAQSLSLFGTFVLPDVLTMTSGLGVYPVSTNPLPGLGPTANLELLEEIYNDPAKASQQEYNSHNTRQIFLYEAFTAPTMREFWRNYNCHCHHFLKINVYQKFPIKRLSLLSAFLVSAYFHGSEPLIYLHWLIFVIYIKAEDVWDEITMKRASGTSKKYLEYVFWISRGFILAHTLGTFDVLHRNLYLNVMYYKYIGYFPFGYPIAMYVIGVCIKLIGKYAPQNLALD